MKIYTIKRKQILKTDVKSAWTFFTNLFNLTAITPPELNLKILNIDINDKNHFYAGMIIEYEISPILGISQKWVTEITHLLKPIFYRLTKVWSL